MTHPSAVLSVRIERPLEVVEHYLADPRNFAAWAYELTGPLTPKTVYAHNHVEASEWLAETPQGWATITFCPPNEFGVADHWLNRPDGSTVYVPLRAVANGDGCEVFLVVFQTTGMNENRLLADADWMRRRLAKLKQLLEVEGEEATP